MYTFLAIVWIGIGLAPLVVFLVRLGRTDRKTAPRRAAVVVGIAVLDLLLLIFANSFMYYYTEGLWFAAQGFVSRFFTLFGAQIILFFSGGLIAAAFLTFTALRIRRPTGTAPLPFLLPAAVLLLSLLFGGAASGSADPFLRFIHQAPTGEADPLWGVPVGFYLFSLPFLSATAAWLSWLVAAGAGIAALGLFADRTMMFPGYLGSERLKAYGRLAAGQGLVLGGLFLLLAAAHSVLGIFGLMLSKHGIVSGVIYVDARVRVPLMFVTAAFFLLASLYLFLAAGVKRLRRIFLLLRRPADGRRPVPRASSAVAAAGILLLVLANNALPPLVESLVVKPNEITLELPYIEHNIDFTRRAYGITDKTVTHYRDPLHPGVTHALVDANHGTIRNIRLWDWRALIDNLRQQQEIRLYYAFPDVDVDRYHIGGEYLQTMLSVRELDAANLDVNSQTWVSRYIIYTHGYGLVLVPVHDVTPDGNPVLLIKNIPPQSVPGGLSVTRPQVYYGEITDFPVVVGTTEKEFDYPKGSDNVYSSYSGKGGIPLDTFLKRFVYGWRLGSQEFVFSNYLTPRSRLLFRRNVLSRARALAPFLTFDRDPYAVLTDKGRIVYILDAYFTSDRFPYAEKYRGSRTTLWGINYIRNSVKVTVDAYDGTVAIYVIDPTDVMLATYRNIYPGLFKPLSSMPADIRRHLRYPEDLFTAQTETYETYHMTDPRVFYQREDVWEFPTERYRGQFQPVSPYYVMIQFPGETEAEFVLMMPFTPKNKNVMNAWLAGRCDGSHYGELVVYELPKGTEVLGPRQVEARIDQDPIISQSLTLWGQRGSEVLRGNLLVIPLFSPGRVSLLYAEPVFLQAEDAHIPQLQRIIMANQTDVVWAASFDDVLAALLGEAPSAGAPGPSTAAAPGPSGATQSDKVLIQKIKDAFAEYQSQIAAGHFQAAGAALEKLSALLKEGR